MKSKSKRRRNLIIVIAGFLLIILIIFAVRKGQTNQGTEVTAEPAELRDLIETVAANGKIQPVKDVMISPFISGEVIAMYVKEGDQVKKGDLLAKIDPEIYRASYERMQANLNSAKANEANAKARLVQVEAEFQRTRLDFERNEKLWKQQVISDAEYETARAAFDVAQAEVEAARQSLKSAEFAIASAKASLDEAQENLTNTAVNAPVDGTVSRLSVEEGERVTGASQFSSGTEIMRLANLDEMEVNVEVNENDIVRVSMGDTCIIEVDAYLDHKFKGVVTEIATSANTQGISADQVTNFDVKIRIIRETYEKLIQGNSPIKSPFRPGMSATVDIQTEIVYQVLTVPIQSVTTRADTAAEKTMETEDEREAMGINDDFIECVFVHEEGKALLRKVKTGVQDNMYIHITEGLEKGEEVITGPYRAVSKRLKDGDEIKVVEKEDLFKGDD
jgi:HlyD family secretion protein